MLPPVAGWALRGWKQFLHEPGFHTCSANSPHADNLLWDWLLRGEVGSAADGEVQHDWLFGWLVVSRRADSLWREKSKS